MKTPILLTTLNARYTHSALGLRYLYANLGKYQVHTSIKEFTINESEDAILGSILDHAPKIIGFGVYIWNAQHIASIILLLKQLMPDMIIILGGPEVSYTPFRCDFESADYIIQGEGEEQLYELCDALMQGIKPTHSIWSPKVAHLEKLHLPYEYYTQHDIENRYIYIESSRGCPFLCEFCLSSIDKKVRYFPQEKIFASLEMLWQKGARTFKFVDRTFNLNIKYATTLLEYFLHKSMPYFLHFEVIPDAFPARLLKLLKKFEPGALQLEVGIQTLDKTVGKNISRRIDISKMEKNLTALKEFTHAHIHLDLLVGLPGQTLASFGEDLEKLMQICSCEIQIGILKKLSGTAIKRHDTKYTMLYKSHPPYDVIQTSSMSFDTLVQMKRFARYWDMYYNSGNFTHSLVLLWSHGRVFNAFFEYCTWLYHQTNTTYKLSLNRLAQYLFEYLHKKNYDKIYIAKILIDDIVKVSGREIPHFLRPFTTTKTQNSRTKNAKYLKRQGKHVE